MARLLITAMAFVSAILPIVVATPFPLTPASLAPRLDPACFTNPGTPGSMVVVPPPWVGKNFFIDNHFIRKHRVSMGVRRTDEGDTSSDGICEAVCLSNVSFFSAFGFGDAAHLFPQDPDFTGQEWLCQCFDAPLTPDLYRPATKNGTWLTPIGGNLCAGY